MTEQNESHIQIVDLVPDNFPLIMARTGATREELEEAYTKGTVLGRRAVARIDWDERTLEYAVAGRKILDVVSGHEFQNQDAIDHEWFMCGHPSHELADYDVENCWKAHVNQFLKEK